MSEIPMEYKVMKKKFSKGLEKALGEDIVSIVVFGGAASNRVFSGVSDVDFCIILKSVENSSKPLSELYQILGNEILSFLDNPLFASLLDYEIYVEDQLPKDDKLNGFSAIRGLALSQGETLIGENPFAGMKFSREQLVSSGRRMVQDYLEKMTMLLFIPPFDSIVKDEEAQEEDESLEAEKEFLAIDAITSSAQALQIITKNEYVNMPDVVFSAETDPMDGVDNELLRLAGLLKQGVDTEVEKLFDRAIDFCSDIIKLLNSL